MTILSKYLPILEKILLTALAVGFFLRLMNIDTTVAMVALVGLAITFFFYAYVPIDVDRGSDAKFGFSELLTFTILPKVLWLSVAISTTAISFYLVGNRGYKETAMIGGSSIAAGTFIFLILAVAGAKYTRALSPIFLRAIPLLLVDVYLLFFL